MKNNKGFSLLEILAVLVILGILGTVVTISVTRYRQDVNEKELVNLHSTISAGYNSYRSNQLMQGNAVLSKMNFCENNQMFLEISYSGDLLTCDDITQNSFVSLRTKGELLSSSSYMSGKTEQDLINDGVCFVEVTGVENNSFVKKCKKTNGSYDKSLEEMVCIKLVISNGTTLINDYEDNDSFCHYLSE